jgi:uncharacterized protein YndB with AHSA1/START domain
MNAVPFFLAASALALLAVGAEQPNRQDTRILRKDVVVRAPLESVWHAWTTEEGLEFVSRKSNVEVRIGGPYEWFLDNEADTHGHRGSEGSRMLAFLPMEMLAFDWTFPRDVPSLRRSGAKTQVVVLFDDLGGGEVRVRLAQHGWGDGEDWDAGWVYFDSGWGYVLDQLKSRLEEQAQQAQSDPPADGPDTWSRLGLDARQSEQSNGALTTDLVACGLAAVVGFVHGQDAL